MMLPSHIQPSPSLGDRENHFPGRRRPYTQALLRVSCPSPIIFPLLTFTCFVKQSPLFHLCLDLLGSLNHYKAIFHYYIRELLMKIGSQTPPWRVPTFIQGILTYSSLSFFEGQSLVLCCPSAMTATEAFILEAQVSQFHDRQATLAALSTSNWDSLSSSPLLLSPRFRLPLLTDPLQRLGRALSLSQDLSANRSETLFFNQHGRLDFRLIHDLTVQGLTRVLEITERYLSIDTHSQFTDPCFHDRSEYTNFEKVEVQAGAPTST